MSDTQPWWTSAVFYQVYPRSFADGDGDGTGDLIGLRERLPHIAELGVDAIWMSPFYRSPMADGGYDVADPCDVDPMFGTLADFDAMLADAHALGIRVTVDLVPNHFSELHPWFQKLLADPDAPERDLFITRPDTGDGPPNNWISVFGGPAWAQLPDGSWYLHLFAPEQPDLNWSNPAVPDEYDRILRFWLDRGVDGFRIDVSHGMAKPAGLPDMPAELVAELASGAHMPSALDPRWDQDAVHDIHRRFRRVIDSYPGDRMAVGEAWVPDDTRLAMYVRPDELNLTFNFELVEAKWGAEPFRAAIEASRVAMAGVGAPCTWVLGNHDVDRPVRRFGGGTTGVTRARAAALVQLSLPGAVYLYNGDELALDNVDLPDSALQDPTWERSGHLARGRDGERVPLPWSGTQPPFGFSPDGVETWLPMPQSWAGQTVADQVADPASMLHLVQAAVRLRRDFADADFEWLETSADVLAYRRDGVLVVLNTGVSTVPLPPGTVLLSSGPLAEDGVPTDTAVWVRG